MKLEDSPLIKDCFIKVSEPFGDFYIFEKFVVSEIAEGVHFDWDKAKVLVKHTYEFFGARSNRINYISNRINSYSVNAQDWLKFYESSNSVSRVAIVAYEEKALLSVKLEKIFTKSSYQTFNTLETAVQWASK